MQAISREFIQVCREGVLDDVVAFVDQHPNVYVHYNNEKAFRACCKRGYVDIVKWFLETYDEVDVRAKDDASILSAYYGGYIDVVHVLDRYDWQNMKHHYDSEVHIFYQICERGYLDVARWFYQKYSDLLEKKCISQAFDATCIRGDFEFVQWFGTVLDDTYIDSALRYACLNNHLQIAKWLESAYPNVNIQQSQALFDKCCVDGYFDIARWLYKNFGQITLREQNINQACVAGNLDMLGWFAEKRADFSKIDDCIETACSIDRFDIVKWLFNVNPYAANRKFNVQAFARACENSNTDICWFLLNRDYDVSSCVGSIYSYMMRYSLFDIDAWVSNSYLEYMYKNNQELFETACANGYMELVKLLVNRDDVDVHGNDNEALCKSIHNEDKTAANWLMANYPVNDVEFVYDNFFTPDLVYDAEAHILVWILENFDVDIHTENEIIFSAIIENHIRMEDDDDLVDVFETLVSKNAPDSGVYYCKLDRYYLVSKDQVALTGTFVTNLICLYDHETETCECYHVQAVGAITNEHLINVTKCVLEQQRSCRKKSARR